MGCDLSHVFCTLSAATPIKSYSPELIVHPVLYSSVETNQLFNSPQGSADEIIKWISRMDSVVIGPGLGRDKGTLACAALVIEAATKKDLPLVIDADGLYLLSKDPLLVKHCNGCVLTPNMNELNRLLGALNEPPVNQESGDDHVLQQRVTGCIKLSTFLGNVCILHKGAADIVTTGTCTSICCSPGSLKRPGGLGDVLTGSVATLLAWERKQRTKHYDRERPPEVPSSDGSLRGSGLQTSCFSLTGRDIYTPALPFTARGVWLETADGGDSEHHRRLVAAAVGASHLTRRFSKAAFDWKHRSMTAVDAIEKIVHNIELDPFREHG